MSGERNPRAKLTEGDVINIIKRYKRGERNQRELSEEYDVSLWTINHAILGISWPHLKEYRS